MASQRTFQSRIGKFSDGITSLKAQTDYNPGKPALQISSLEILQTSVTDKNAQIVTLENDLKSLRNERKSISFAVRGSDKNCIEKRMRAIANYIKSENTAEHPAYLKMVSIISKLSPPHYKKRSQVEGETPKSSISRSEKTFQSLLGFGNDVCTMIANLGASYQPTNTNITGANFTAVIERLAQLNASIITAEGNYSTAVEERFELYNGENGISQTIKSIKNYLASFEGGKKSAAYTAFNNAVK